MSGLLAISPLRRFVVGVECLSIQPSRLCGRRLVFLHLVRVWMILVAGRCPFHRNGGAIEQRSQLGFTWWVCRRVTFLLFPLYSAKHLMYAVRHVVNVGLPSDQLTVNAHRWPSLNFSFSLLLDYAMCGLLHD